MHAFEDGGDPRVQLRRCCACECSRARHGDVEVEQRIAAGDELLQVRRLLLQVRARAHEGERVLQATAGTARESCRLRAGRVPLCFDGLQLEVTGAAIAH